MNKFLIKMAVRSALVDEMRTVYDKANKSIILENEIEEMIEYIFNKHWRYVWAMYKMPIDVYRDTFQDAITIAKGYEGRYI